MEGWKRREHKGVEGGEGRREGRREREEETRDGAGGRAAGPRRPQAVGVGTCLSLVFLGTGLPGCPGLCLLSPPNY